MPRVISILSGKGGVGKTTLSSNLGAALAGEFGKKVAIVDGNITSPSLGLHFGFHEKFPSSLNDVLSGKLNIKKCTYIHPTIGVSIIPCTFAFNSDKNIHKLKKVIRHLKFDYVIIDSAPGLGKEAISAMMASDEVIVITTPHFIDISAAAKTMQLARKLKKKALGIVLNRVEGTQYEVPDEEIGMVCGTKIITKVPEHRDVRESSHQGVPLVVYKPNSQSAKMFRGLAAALAGANDWKG